MLDIVQYTIISGYEKEEKPKKREKGNSSRSRKEKTSSKHSKERSSKKRKDKDNMEVPPAPREKKSRVDERNQQDDRIRDTLEGKFCVLVISMQIICVTVFRLSLMHDSLTGTR